MGQDDPIGTSVADQSLQIAAALAAEVAVLRERLEIVERLAAAHGLFGPGDVDAYVPEAVVAEAFAARRRAFIERVFGTMRLNQEFRQ